MNIVLLQTQLSLQEIDLLLQEFPQYLFLSLNENSYKNLNKEHWGRIEILFGGRLTDEELAMAHNLRWIHTPSPYLNRLCLHEIDKQGNILITNTSIENVTQTGEFVLGCVLAYAKNLFHWSETEKNPLNTWGSRFRDTVWTLKGRVHLQLGLERVGTEITRCMRQMGMKVWGVLPEKSFHPYCHKTYGFQELHAALPQADVVCLAFPRGKEYENFLGQKELELLKEDAILIIIGSANTVNQEALASLAKSERLRGIVLDAHYQNPIPKSSELWKAPRLLITPEIAPRPKLDEGQGFRTFLFNMRQYLYGNFKDMKNLVEEGALFEG